MMDHKIEQDTKEFLLEEKELISDQQKEIIKPLLFK